jgi:hypothetical protein
MHCYVCNFALESPLAHVFRESFGKAAHHSSQRNDDNHNIVFLSEILCVYSFGNRGCTVHV